MKKSLATILALCMSATALTACGAPSAASSSTAESTSQAASSSTDAAASTDSTTAAAATEIRVVTSYGGDDGNRANYEDAVKGFEDATGNTVVDESATSNEQWKAQVKADFQTGSEPDVLFFFTGTDANEFIKNGKVVSIDTIRAEYPEYATNMLDSAMPLSFVDAKAYAVPSSGYWEGLFVNKKVLADCGVEVPDANTTWDEFMADCQTIKDKGYTPVACSLAEVPHYWFEYTILNQGDVAKHAEVPASSTDAAGTRWAAGFDTMKEMYDKGFFPTNTLTAGDADTFQMMADDQAAFAIDGSWKVGWFTGTDDAEGNVANIDDYTVTYVPGAGSRKATDIVGGISMGYYITENAWNDPAKRDAAVKFVEYMTTDEQVNKFAAGAPTALKSGIPEVSDTDSLHKAAIEMFNNKTGLAGAVQDGLNQTARSVLFASVKDIVTGTTPAATAIETALATPLAE
ncbi:MAG: extracellular solute-binding protein [Gemmiger sp.]|nr:extracellular solute-binding protein [Gemmiger sp.]